MRAEFEDRPFGVGGEFAIPRAEPVPAAAPPFVIPPPPWSENYRAELDPDPEPEPLPKGRALRRKGGMVTP
jgi:hypothetical protein